MNLKEEKWMSELCRDFPKAELFFVGGCVRDAILQRPIKDTDLVIRNLTRQEIETWFSRHGVVNYVGKQFGVYKFIATGTADEIDIALPRSEQALSNSHGGYKEFAVEARSDFPIELDLSRRDFTVNAMAIDVRTQKLIDPFHGERDITARIIRAVGKPADRFAEDLSRLLRAIRFACSLGFHIEEATWSAIKEYVPRLNEKQDDQWIVPRETVGKEFLKSFFADSLCTLIRYEQAGLTTLLFPTLDLEKTKKLLKESAGLPPRQLLALFLLSFDQQEAERVSQTYHFSQFPKTDRRHMEMSDIQWIIRAIHALDLIENPALLPGSTFERLFLGPRADDLIDLLKLTRPQSPSLLSGVQERMEAIRLMWGDEIPDLIHGEDLIALNLKPGPQFRQIQQTVRDAQIDGKIQSKEEALIFVQKFFLQMEKK